MSFNILARRQRTSRHTITANDANGDPVPFDAGTFPDKDVWLLKIVTLGKSNLEIDSRQPPSNTSWMTAENPSTLTLDQIDMNLITPGTYDMEVSIVDQSDNNRLKHIDSGIFVLLDTPAGAVQ